MESHGNHSKSASGVLKTARDLIGVGAALDGEKDAAARLKSASPAQFRIEQIIEPQEQVMALEVPDRVERLEGQDRERREPPKPDLLMEHQWFMLASIVGSANRTGGVVSKMMNFTEMLSGLVSELYFSHLNHIVMRFLALYDCMVNYFINTHSTNRRQIVRKDSGKPW